MKIFAVVLLLTVSLANAQSLKLRIDPAYPDQPLKTLPLLQAATPIIDVQTFEDGMAYTNLSGHSAVWYCGTSATGVFVIVTNSAAGSGYFRLTPTAAQLNTNGTFWSTVLWRNASSNVLYSGTGVVQIARTTVTGNPGTLSTSIPLNLALYSILGVLPEVNLPMAAIMTNLTAGVTPGLSAVLAVNANANGGAITNIGTLRFAPYNDTLEYDPADDVFRFGARLAGYASESTFDAATNALHGRINASGLAQTLARGNDANGGAITNVGRIGAESSAAGAVLQVRRNDGNLNEGEIIMSTGDTTGGAAMVHMEIEDVTDYYFQRDRVSLGGKPITNATMDAGALTGTVPLSRLPPDVLTSNSVAQTLTASAAPVSGAAVLALTNDMLRPSVVTNSYAPINLGYRSGLGSDASGSNIFVGLDAGISSTVRTGAGFGTGALKSSGGSFQHAIGYDAGWLSYGMECLFAGTDAGKLFVGTNSTAVGQLSLAGAMGYGLHGYGWGAGYVADHSYMCSFFGKSAGAYASRTNMLFLSQWTDALVPADPTNDHVVIYADGSMAIGAPGYGLHLRGPVYKDGVVVATLADIGSPTNALLLAGGTMAGDIAMGGNDVTGAGVVDATTHRAGGTDYTQTGAQWVEGSTVMETGDAGSDWLALHGADGTVRTDGSLYATGSVHAAAYYGDGSGLTNVTGSGQTVSVGYTGDPLPRAVTNGGAVAIIIPTNAPAVVAAAQTNYITVNRMSDQSFSTNVAVLVVFTNTVERVGTAMWLNTTTGYIHVEQEGVYSGSMCVDGGDLAAGKIMQAFPIHVSAAGATNRLLTFGLYNPTTSAFVQIPVSFKKRCSVGDRLGAGALHDDTDAGAELLRYSATYNTPTMTVGRDN